MKKYLTSGVLAIIACGFMTSCHETEIDYASQIEAKKATFAENFVKFYGEIDPNQDWGFGTTTRGISGITRSGNTGETYPATHEYEDANGNVVAGANMNHNEWADPTKETGGWEVVPALTPEQKAVVTAYFQCHPNLGYEDPQLRHFFVQQVYKGGTAQAGPSSESITAASGTVSNSSVMNLLTVGQANSHINDFNAGTCSESDVLDNGQSVGGSSHKDQITLMVNVDDTSCFGYHETASSTHHNNKAALVSWETIHTWAQSNYSGYEAGFAGWLDDGYNRSYMGFDLALKEGAEAYATDANTGNVIWASYDQAPEAPAYGWDGEEVIQIAEVTKEYPDPNNIYWYNEIKTYTENLGVGYLTTNQNFYVAGEKVVLDQSYQNGEIQASSLTDVKNAVCIKDLVYNGTKYQAVVNLVKIRELIADGYLPVMNTSLTQWVKVGKSDGYFTDWIVTLTKAERIDEITTTGGTITTGQTTTGYYLRKYVQNHRWVFCEDLGQASNRKDFDYNDLVFDAKIIQEYEVTNTDGVETVTEKGSPYALITPLAAGGELSITVANKNVHEMFGLDDAVLINTIDPNNTESEVLSSGVAYAPSEARRIDCTTSVTYDTDNILDIPIYVKIYGEAISLRSAKGKVPHKIAVTPGTRWAQERVDINDAQPGFAEWVKDATFGETFWSPLASPKRYPYMPSDKYLVKNMTRQYLPDEYIDGGTTDTYSVNLASNEAGIWSDEIQLYSGSEGVQLSSTDFAEGSIIRIYGVSNSNSSWELYVYSGSEEIYQKSEDSALFGYVEFKLNANTAGSLRDNGMVITGNGLTILCVSIDNTLVRNTSN